ncbi:hypothetical protein C8R41DRAFT_924739 [Lentinula lateritia]|uniref:Chitinase n=1 Tax=Lentinula lateritia TaxID=40482 RepID=A0ABQ8V6E5_9AGAR|nr:hypothetical protein C8R41DRAFT_924739 [Lentinula lateritia]
MLSAFSAGIAPQRSNCTWSSTLCRLLNPTARFNHPWESSSYSTTVDAVSATPNNFQDSYFRPPGILWRSFVAKCVYKDLYALTVQDPNLKLDFGPKNRRRVARMNEYGLGAVVFYEIPFNSLNERDTSPKEWTIGGVFGNGDPSSGTGMTVDELLDGIDVRLVYIPLYACTSFVTSQVMNSFFRRLQSHQEKMDPICVSGEFGFSVCSEDFTLFDHGLGSLSSSLPAASRFATPRSNFAGNIYMNVDRECSNSVPVLRPILTKEGNEGTRSSRNKTDSSHEIVNVKNTNDADDLDKQQPDVSPRNLQTIPTHGQDEQWELDWVDAELSIGFCHSDTTGHEDNIILQQDEDEEQDAEESFVTALESLLSDDCLPIDKFKDVSQARNSHMCSPVSGAVFLKVDASTPTIASNTTITATILDSRHPIHVNPDLAALSSITNLKSAGSIVTESKCPSSSPKICSQSTCSPEEDENPNSGFESTGGTFSSLLHPHNSDCTHENLDLKRSISNLSLKTYVDDGLVISPLLPSLPPSSTNLSKPSSIPSRTTSTPRVSTIISPLVCSVGQGVNDASHAPFLWLPNHHRGLKRALSLSSSEGDELNTDVTKDRKSGKHSRKSVDG